jgi:hypothetical protein
MKKKIDLLEKAKDIVEWDKYGFYENLKDTDIGKFSPPICRALLGAIGEIERDQLKSGNWDTQTGMLGALEIIRKHLGVEK